ncbi:PRES [Mytilus edulis]|uniref:SLC26A5 n=1 Tax=Mytilus edulis TaxID=6550 RepID=A0A8S3SZJ1_MYTED|nr:PRES [Mytilus edulis]
MEDNFVHIEREPVTQESFDKLYRKSEGKLHLNDKLKDTFNCSTDKLWRRMSSVFPIVAALRYYNFREKFVNDILAGITGGLFQIPHALAFALLASVKVENGLYTSIWPVMLYAIFGTSIHASIGTSAVVCMFTRSIVNREVAKYEGTVPFNSSLSSGLLNNSEFLNYKENVALNIGFLCGISLLIFGILKITFIAHLLSEPFLKAFTSAAAVHIIISQLPLVLGINIKTHGGVFKIVNICKDIINNLTYIKGLTLLTAVVTIIVLLFFKEFVNEKFKSRFRIPIPAELMVVILAVTISATTVLHREVTIIGHITGVIPQPAIPNLSGCQTYLLDSFVLAIFMYAHNATLSRIFAKKHNYVVNYNQESFAHGICNFVGSFFHCIPVSASPRRSMVLSLMNANTTLAGIYIASEKNAKTTKRSWKFTKNTAETIKNGMSGDENTNKTSLPKKEVSDQNSITVTSDIPAISVAYGNVKNRSISTVSRNIYGQNGISRQESEANSLSSTISNLTFEPEMIDPDDGQEYITDRKYESMRKVHHVIVDFSTVNYIDLTGAKMLGQISSEYGNVNIKLFLASCSPDIQKTMRHAGILDTIPADCIFIDLYDAIAIAKSGWTYKYLRTECKCCCLSR